jgi:hypothetical protein
VNRLFGVAPAPTVNRQQGFSKSPMSSCANISADPTPSPTAPKENPGGWKRLVRGAGLSCLFLLFWFVLINVPEFVAPEKNYSWSSNLTASWEEGLAILFERGAQAGKDYIFTYGPLGFLASCVFDPPTFWHKYAWEVALSFFAAWAFLKVFVRLPDVFSKSWFVYLVLSQDLDYVDNRCAILLLAAAVLLVDVRSISVFLVAAMLVFALLGLMKFTFLVLATFLALGLTVCHGVGGRRRPALAIPALYGAFLAVGWLGAGQAPRGLGPFLRGSYEIARGYGEAMCLPIAPAYLGLGLAQLALLPVLGLTLNRSGQPWVRRWTIWCFFTAAVLIQWKLGFTRDDHTRVFFKYGLIIPFLLIASFPPSQSRRFLRYLLTSLCLGIGFVGLTWPEPPVQLVLLPIIAAVTLNGGAGSPGERWLPWLLFVAAGFAEWALASGAETSSHLAFKYGLAVPLMVVASLAPTPSRRALLGGARGLCAALGIGAVLWLEAPQVPRLLGPFALLPNSASRTVEYGKTWVGRAEFALAPQRVRAELQAIREQDRESPLFPQLDKEVGRASVDLFSFNQGVLFSQGMNWQPRPVFQSYSAYTPFLLEKNRDFFRGDNAPEYVVFVSPALDGRLFSQEDSQALFEILRRYRVVSIDQSRDIDRALLLFKRDRSAATREPTPEKVLLQRTVKLQEFTSDGAPPPEELVELGPLPAEYQSLSITLHYSGWGLIRAMFYQPPTVWIRLWCSGEKEPRLRRLVPGTASQSFLINPFVDKPADLKSLFDDPGALRVRSLDLLVLGDKTCYEENVLVTVKKVSRPAAADTPEKPRSP